MIEILVTISIIILLIGIGTAVASRFAKEAERQRIESMMKGLMGANEEFKAVRQQGSINHDGTFPINWSKVSAGSSSARFVRGCEQVKSVEEAMIAALNSGSERQFERTFIDGKIFDSWRKEIEYRSFNDGTGRGPTTNVANNLLPISLTPFFVSAGPDKVFGTDDDITTIENPVYNKP